MSKSPYEGLRFRIHNLPLEVNLLKEFNELGKHEELKTTIIDNNKILRYCIYMFDPKSELIKEVTQLKERKAKALNLAGYKKNKDGTFEQDAELILNGMSHDIEEQQQVIDEVQRVTFCMLTRVYNDRKFREWQTLHEELDENTQFRMSKIIDKGDKATVDAIEKKGKLREQAKAIHVEIDALEKEIFGDHEELKEHALTVRFSSPEAFVAAYAGQDTED